MHNLENYIDLKAYLFGFVLLLLELINVEMIIKIIGGIIFIVYNAYKIYLLYKQNNKKNE